MHTHTPTTRRGFLTAGSTALALGVLVGRPGIANAERTSAISGTSVAAQIGAILDRPSVAFFGEGKAICQCSECQAIRRSGLQCLLCGFKGVPLVEPCECLGTRASNIDYCTGAIAAIQAGHVPGPNDSTLTQLEHYLLEEFARPDDVRCPAFLSTDERKAFREDGGTQCGHGTVWCPSCGQYGAIGEPMDIKYLLAKLREVRAVLATAR